MCVCKMKNHTYISKEWERNCCVNSWKFTFSTKINFPKSLNINPLIPALLNPGDFWYFLGTAHLLEYAFLPSVKTERESSKNVFKSWVWLTILNQISDEERKRVGKKKDVFIKKNLWWNLISHLLYWKKISWYCLTKKKKQSRVSYL